VEATIEHLQELRGRLKRLSDACCGGAEAASNCSIIESLEGGAPV